jgi:hypothetical protein
VADWPALIVAGIAAAWEPEDGDRNDPLGHRRLSQQSEGDTRLYRGGVEDGDPELIALALDDVARAKGLAHDALSAQSDTASVIRTLQT